MPDHRFALSAEVHEPKHITSTTTADAGKVITPSATTSGESELRYLSSADLSDGASLTPTIVYGEMQLEQNSTSFAITAATDSELYTASDYVLINSVRAPGVILDQVNGMTLDNVNNTLEVPVEGIYRITGWFNVVSDTISSKIGVSYTNNGVVAGLKPKTDVKDSGRVQNLTGTGLLSASSGDKVGIALACSTSANLTIKDFNIILELIEAI